MAIQGRFVSTGSRSFEVLVGDGSMVLVATDNGDVLNPTKNLTKDQQASLALESKFYQKMKREIRIDKIKAILKKLILDKKKIKPRQKTLDEAVKNILAQDKGYQQFLKRRTERRKLRQGATDHFNAVLHTFWAVKNLSEIGTPEPPRGKYDQEAWETYVNHIKMRPEKTTSTNKRSPARKKLDNMFKVAQEKRLKPKKPPFFQMSSSGVEEEPE